MYVRQDKITTVPLLAARYAAGEALNSSERLSGKILYASPETEINLEQNQTVRPDDQPQRLL